MKPVFQMIRKEKKKGGLVGGEKPLQQFSTFHRPRREIEQNLS